MKLLMLKGLPGSGKSTWAKNFISQNRGWVRINKDSLREMMFGYKPGKDEKLILTWRDELITHSLLAGKNVIVDDTNFHPKHEARLNSLLESCAATKKIKGEFEVMVFHTPLEECIKNDLKRHNSVGEKVIKKMYREYLASKFEKPSYCLTYLDAIICDLDGTIAIHNGRSPYDTEKCDTDLINPIVKEILTKNSERVIFVSGREDKFRSKTEAWLKQHGIVYDALFMRPTGDRRADDIIKQEIYDQEIKDKYNVKFVLDDRNRVVDMWRRNGLTCLQVADGDF